MPDLRVPGYLFKDVARVRIEQRVHAILNRRLYLTDQHDWLIYIWDAMRPPLKGPRELSAVRRWK